MALPRNPDRGLYCRVNVLGEDRWYVRIAVNGRMRTFAPHGGFPTEKEAREFLDNSRADLRRGKFFPESFTRQVLPLKALLEQQEKRRPETPNAKNDGHYQKWWIAHYGRRDVRTLDPPCLDEARRSLEAEQKRPQTIHHYLKFLRHALNLAIRDEQLDRSPFQRVKLPPVHNLRERFYSVKERRALYAALGPIWREAAELAGLTGLRWSEQFGLERSRVNVAAGHLVLATTKAGRPQTRLLNRRARELCRLQLKRAGTSRWLYPNQANTGPIDYANFRKRIWLPACEAAGLANARWNDWRHTFGSDLTMAGHSDRTVAHLLGHTSTQMVKRYAHLAPSHLKEAVEGLGTAKQLHTQKRSKKRKSA
jgi:site-specific recombinase XerD